MSFGSSDQFLKKMGVTNDTATNEQREEALWLAFNKELPDGVAFIKSIADKVKRNQKMIIALEGYTEQIIKDCQRLLGNTIPKTILEKRLGVALGSYNCHYAVGAPDHEKLVLTMQTQIDLQNGALANVDC